jgi:hypothetical protein
MAKTVFEIDIETAGAVASAKDLREQFNILEDKMFELAAAGKEGTKEFAAIRNQLAGTKERIDDLNESIDMLKPEAKFQAFANLGAGIANGFAAAQGAAQLFGSESEALNESLAKVQAAMALAQGIQGLAGMGDSLKIVGAMLKSTAIGTKIVTAAQWLWNAAVAANPIGAIVAAVAALVAGIYLLVNAQDDETEAMEKSIKQRERELELMNEAAEKLKNENKFRLDLAAAQGKNAQELAKINEENTKAEIKSIDKRVQALKQEIVERSALMKFRDGKELKELQEANSKSLEEMKKLANDRLALQQGLKIQEAKLETDANKEKETKDKDKAAKEKEAADKKKAKDLADAEFYRQSEQKFIDYSIEALSNKFGDAEQLIAKQRIETRIALGYATPQEIEAYNAFKLKQETDYQNAVDAELKRLSDLQNKRREENNARIQAEFEAEKKRRDEELAIRKRNSDFAVQSTLQSLNAVQELTDAFAGKSIESQKKAFNVKKAASLAQTTIETYLAAQSAFASQVVPGDPTSPIRGAVAAGLAIASGLARVAVIAKQKFEAPSTGGGGGGGNLGTFSQGGGQPPQGLTAQNTVTQLNPDGTVASQGQRQAAPMKAYVVESESRAVTERVNKLSNNSKIG